LIGWQEELASSDASSVGEISSTTTCDSILTQGRAWAISITQRSTINEEISRAFISSGAGIDENLIYRFVSLILNHIHRAVLVY
jgi:hypothetical protein